jgi:hypothetical protein
MKTVMRKISMNNIAAKLLSAILVSLMLFSYGYAGEGSTTGRYPDFPSYYPDSFQRQGRFQGIDLQKGTLTIDAIQYVYDNNMRIHTLNTEYGSPSMLKPGMAIGFQLHSYTKDDKRIVSEIWILPPGVLLES